MDNILSFLGLMKRAGELAIGADGAREAIRLRKARLALVAADAAENAGSSVGSAAAEESVLFAKLPFTKAELGGALGQKECAALCITDTGFALALCEKAGFSDMENALAQRLLREKTRTLKKSAAGAARKRRK